jgi:hypothetical protein
MVSSTVCVFVADIANECCDVDVKKCEGSSEHRGSRDGRKGGTCNP